MKATRLGKDRLLGPEPVGHPDEDFGGEVQVGSDGRPLAREHVFDGSLPADSARGAHDRAPPQGLAAGQGLLRDRGDHDVGGKLRIDPRVGRPSELHEVRPAIEQPLGEEEARGERAEETEQDLAQGDPRVVGEQRAVAPQ